MRNLGKLKLSDAKVMDSNEMKAIIGGQMKNTQCGSTGGSGADITCGGECPTVQPEASGSSGQKVTLTCQTDTKSINFKPITICMCK